MTATPYRFAYAALILASLSTVATRAEEAQTAPKPEVSLDLPMLNSYVWRGQVLNDKPVLQPSATINYMGFTLNSWNNFNLTDRVGDARKFNECDLLVSYTLPIEAVNVNLGVTEYTFPNQTKTTVDEEGNATTEAYPSTREAFASVGAPVILEPTLSVWYDFGEVDGWYGSLSISHSVEVADKLSLGAAASVGAGNSAYNDYYFAENANAFNDANLTLNAEYAALDNLSLKGFFTVGGLLDSTIRDNAEDLYFNKGTILIFGGSANYTF